MKKSIILTGIFLYTAVFLSFSQSTPGKGKFTNFTEGGLLIGNSQDTKHAPFIFHSSMNYGLNKNVSAGMGVGVEFLQETYLPVMANVMYQFRKDKAVFPFIRLQGGYQVALESASFSNISYYYPYSYLDYVSYYQSSTKLDAKGGWMLDPSVGIIVYTRAGLGFTLAAGYRYQKLKYTGDNEYILWTEYNRLTLSLGITF